MVIESYITDAQTCVQAEQEALDDKHEAYETFIQKVEKLQVYQRSASATGIKTVGGMANHSSDRSRPDRCRLVRNIFDQTIRPHSVADIDESEPLLETIRQELTDEIAVALAPTTEISFTSELKQMTLTEAKAQQLEIEVCRQAIDREESQVSDVNKTVENILTWIVEANETRLLELSFDALKQRHETLAEYRNRCDEIAYQRQDFINKSTTRGVDVGFEHRSLIPYLYQDLEIDFPVLATVANLDMACQSCQRTIRQQLIRRV